MEVELIEGLAKLFSTQLALGNAQRQADLLKDAEIRALEAQIHPHFLFNAINTIYALCRTDVEQARTLLLELSTFFRSNLQGARSTKIPLQKELEHIEAYTSLEAARFPNRPFLDIDLAEETTSLLVPPFILQPLIENAFLHAFLNEQTGYVGVTAWCEADQLYLEVVPRYSIRQNGFEPCTVKKDSLRSRVTVKTERRSQFAFPLKSERRTSMRTLLIEDEPLARDELRYHVTAAGLEVVGETGSVEEAERLVRSLQPDLVFLDIELTDGSGLEVAKRLKSMPRPPALLFVTAYDAHALEAFELNAYDYILKPYDPARIVRAIEKVARPLRENENRNGT